MINPLIVWKVAVVVLRGLISHTWRIMESRKRNSTRSLDLRRDANSIKKTHTGNPAGLDNVGTREWEKAGNERAE